MSVYVDDYRAEFKPKAGRRMVMSHLMADTPDELHEMARALGLKLVWFQGDHYDVSETKRAEAIKLGAIACTPMDCVRIRKKWQAAGLGKWWCLDADQRAAAAGWKAPDCATPTEGSAK